MHFVSLGLSKWKIVVVFFFNGNWTCGLCNSNHIALGLMSPILLLLVVQWSRLHLPMQEMQEMWVRYLGWEDYLEKEMATQSSILVWKIPWIQEPGRLQSMESQRVGHGCTYTHMQCRKVKPEFYRSFVYPYILCYLLFSRHVAFWTPEHRAVLAL